MPLFLRCAMANTANNLWLPLIDFENVYKAFKAASKGRRYRGEVLDITGGTTKKLSNKRAGFSVDYAIRLQNAQIECCDALKVIRSRDSEKAFFYCDPPYVGSDQGHYDGYTQEDFDGLLGLLETIKGKFLLSSFRNKSLADSIKRNGWHSFELKMACSMTNRYESKRGKVEVLTANYPIEAPDKKA
jgi:DNA adenine methylase